MLAGFVLLVCVMAIYFLVKHSLHNPEHSHQDPELDIGLTCILELNCVYMQRTVEK